MKAEIIGVGTELLLGQIANTDAQFLSNRLSQLGIDVYYHHVVGDNDARFTELFKKVLDRADIIITTGGIGPTMDDLTKETIAKALDLEMVLDVESQNKIQDFFKSIHKNMTSNNIKQAYFPKGCKIIKNDRGTAPGCIIEHNSKMIIILPGPPRELNYMFDTYIAKELMDKTGSVIVSRFMKMFGVGESELEDKLMELIKAQTNPTIATYASAGEVMLRVSAKASTQRQASQLLEPVCQEIREIIGDKIYSEDGESLAQKIVGDLIENDIKIALAESCTGGMLSSMIVDIPGSSKVLLEGIVTYSNESKINRLNVKPSSIDKFGAVSNEVAKEMAIGLYDASDCEIALSITGVAGPEDAGDKKAGLVYIGMYDGIKCKVLKLEGNRRDRQYNRYISCLRALDMIRGYIQVKYSV